MEGRAEKAEMGVEVQEVGVGELLLLVKAF